jgi:hypothetical protein
LEAWIGREFRRCGFDPAATAAVVMPVLGRPLQVDFILNLV